MKNLEILEIGSGTSGHHTFIQTNIKDVNITHVDFNIKANHLEVCADGQHLPFKNKFFDVCYTAHVLEHMPNPMLYLTELKRVTKQVIIIKVPNALYFHTTTESNEHIFSWTPESFNALIKRTFNHFVTYPSYHNRYVKGQKVKNLFRYLKTYALRTKCKYNELTAVIKLNV